MKRWSAPLALLLRVVLAGVLVWAGVQKARDPQQFALDLEAYRLLPSWIVLPLAYYLPWLEIATALGLFIPALRRSALILALLVLIAFTLMLALARARGLQINCGCFGAVGTGATDFLLAIGRNACLIAAALWLRSRRPTSGLGVSSGGG